MSVIYRSDRKKWAVNFRLDGKRKQRLFKSKQRAENFEDQIKLQNLGLKANNYYTIAEALSDYLVTESSQKQKGSRLKDERFFKIVRHFFERLHNKELLNEIRIEDLQLFQIWLAEPQKVDAIDKAAWSDTSIARQCKTLKSVLKKAHKHERIQKDPSLHWEIPAGEGEKRRPMTHEEFQLLIQFVPKWYLPIIRTLRLTGARGSSLAALTWDRVDFSTATLYLSSRKGGRKKMKLIPIPILPELQDILVLEWNRYCVDKRTDGAVFRHESGSPVTASQISHFGFKSIKAAGLNGVVLYGLRHALATDLIEAGVSTDIARRIMGHSSERQLQDYTHNLSLTPLRNALQLISKKKPEDEST